MTLFKGGWKVEILELLENRMVPYRRYWMFGRHGFYYRRNAASEGALHRRR